MSTFGCGNKFLVDNGHEFDNDLFITLCENLNARICKMPLKAHGVTDLLNDRPMFWAIL